jgi:transposase-like protein
VDNTIIYPACPKCGLPMTPWYGCVECSRYACHECKNFLEIPKEGYKWSEEKQLFVKKEGDE